MSAGRGAKSPDYSKCAWFASRCRSPRSTASPTACPTPCHCRRRRPRARAARHPRPDRLRRRSRRRRRAAGLDDQAVIEVLDRSRSCPRMSCALRPGSRTTTPAASVRRSRRRCRRWLGRSVGRTWPGLQNHSRRAADCPGIGYRGRDADAGAQAQETTRKRSTRGRAQQRLRIGPRQREALTLLAGAPDGLETALLAAAASARPRCHGWRRWDS